jgi:hypothetical protein
MNANRKRTKWESNINPGRNYGSFGRGSTDAASHFSYGTLRPESVEVRCRDQHLGSAGPPPSAPQIAHLIGADPKEIIFTSGATESNNTAIKGVATYLKDKKKHIITTQVCSPLAHERVLVLPGELSCEVEWARTSSAA